MKIKYTGPDDARILDASDLLKGDVEGFRKTTFNKGEVTEIDDAAGEALLRVPEVYGNFEEVAGKAEAEAEADAEPKSKKSTKTAAVNAAPGEAATTSSTPSTAPSGRASTGS